jgi:hypothetical protein
VAFAVLLAAFSFLASVNEYAAVFGQEMSGAYDCDGPRQVLIFSAPPLLLASAGVFLSLRALRARRSRQAVIAVALGVAVLCAIAVRAPGAIAELRKNSRAGSPCR